MAALTQSLSWPVTNCNPVSGHTERWPEERRNLQDRALSSGASLKLYAKWVQTELRAPWEGQHLASRAANSREKATPTEACSGPLLRQRQRCGRTEP